MPQKIPVRSKKRNPVNHVADQKNMKYRGEEIDKNAKKIWAKKQIVETLYLSKCNILDEQALFYVSMKCIK